MYLILFNISVQFYSKLTLEKEPMTRFELVTSSLPRKRSTPELHRRKVFTSPFEQMGFLPSQELRAGDRVRTGDIQLGRLTLYQLSYSRNSLLSILQIPNIINSFDIWVWKCNFHAVGRAGFEPAKVKTNRFTVCPRWPLEYLPN